eukprot:XP_001701696.1 predicted protein [Chlamydomonas reinhardtii]
MAPTSSASSRAASAPALCAIMLVMLSGVASASRNRRYLADMPVAAPPTQSAEPPSPPAPPPFLEPFGPCRSSLKDQPSTLSPFTSRFTTHGYSKYPETVFCTTLTLSPPEGASLCSSMGAYTVSLLIEPKCRAVVRTLLVNGAEKSPSVMDAPTLGALVLKWTQLDIALTAQPQTTELCFVVRRRGVGEDGGDEGGCGDLSGVGLCQMSVLDNPDLPGTNCCPTTYLNLSNPSRSPRPGAAPGSRAPPLPPFYLPDPSPEPATMPTSPPPVYGASPPSPEPPTPVDTPAVSPQPSRSPRPGAAPGSRAPPLPPFYLPDPSPEPATMPTSPPPVYGASPPSPEPPTPVDTPAVSPQPSRSPRPGAAPGSRAPPLPPFDLPDPSPEPATMPTAPPPVYACLATRLRCHRINEYGSSKLLIGHPCSP